MARERKGLSQRALSEKSGVPQSHISKIEKVWKLYINLKKDLQHFLATCSYQNFWLYHYSRSFYSKKSKKDMLLKNYIKENYTHICFLDP